MCSTFVFGLELTISISLFAVKAALLAHSQSESRQPQVNRATKFTSHPFPVRCKVAGAERTTSSTPNCHPLGGASHGRPRGRWAEVSVARKEEPIAVNLGCCIEGRAPTKKLMKVIFACCCLSDRSKPHLHSKCTNNCWKIMWGKLMWKAKLSVTFNTCISAWVSSHISFYGIRSWINHFNLSLCCKRNFSIMGQSLPQLFLPLDILRFVIGKAPHKWAACQYGSKFGNIKPSCFHMCEVTGITREHAYFRAAIM